MIRTISLLVISVLSFSNIQAFDQDVLNKTTKLLEQKKIKRVLTEKLDPVKYAQKKEKYAQKNAITAQQYLENKHRELLNQYELLQAKLALDSVLSVLTTVADGLFVLGVALKNTWHLNDDIILFSAAFFANIVIFGVFNIEIIWAQQKKETLLKILDTKINKTKTQIRKDKEILDRKNSIKTKSKFKMQFIRRFIFQEPKQRLTNSLLNNLSGSNNNRSSLNAAT
jgi:hypothetical protein